MFWNCSNCYKTLTPTSPVLLPSVHWIDRTQTDSDWETVSQPSNVKPYLLLLLLVLSINNLLQFMDSCASCHNISTPLTKPVWLISGAVILHFFLSGKSNKLAVHCRIYNEVLFIHLLPFIRKGNVLLIYYIFDVVNYYQYLTYAVSEKYF